ncbi:hypothetical protein N7517_002690 [Penicillium concentricum]|uniref:Methyltransferase domain-containing protein n=1 Tax=Penicillium concentricum TaxID=293559 RepID=A0A9W9SVZ3_9EURO|nr:uncharacterized protein N7517_002690 [Penicillium concentricum]KAJ5384779.1 hypothetical protein N7517_002690 [Penicillium concentricum]
MFSRWYMVYLSRVDRSPYTKRLQRDEAFKIYHYACIGQIRFLSFNLSSLPFYNKVLDRLRSDTTAGFLDAGCCLGQELRFLANREIPDSQLFDCDIEQVFVDLGYRLFRDRGHLDATFVVGDMAAVSGQDGACHLEGRLGGKINIVFASSLFHLWDYETQVRAAVRLVRLCCSQTGVMITGRQMGGVLAGHHELKGIEDGAMQYRHNIESMKGFWWDVGEATATRWTLEAGFYFAEELEQTKNSPSADSNLRMIWWCATRL